MGSAQTIHALFADFEAGFTRKLIGEEAAAHADLTVNAPNRKIDAFGIEGLLPCEHMLIDAIDQRAIEIKEKDGFKTHSYLAC